MALHGRNVDRIASGERRAALNDLPCAEHVVFLNRVNLVHDLQRYSYRGINRITPVNRIIAMQNLLEYFGIGHQAFAFGDQALQKDLGFRLMRMRRPDQVHRNVGIDKDHAW